MSLCTSKNQIMLLLGLCACLAAGPATAPADPSEAVKAFAAAVLSGDQTAAQAVSQPGRANEELVGLVCELARQYRQLNEATNDEIDYHQHWLLQEIDAFPRRQMPPDISGDDARFMLDPSTAYIRLHRDGNTWRVDPFSLYRGAMPERLDEIRANVTAMHEVVPKVKQRALTDPDAIYRAFVVATHREQLRLAAAVPPAKVSPPDLSSPRSAFIEVWIANNSGSFARIAEVTVPAKGAEEVFAAMLEMSAAQTDFNDAIFKSCELVRLAPQSPAAIEATEKQLRAGAEDVAQHQTFRENGDNAVVTDTRPGASGPFSFTRSKGSWKMIWEVPQVGGGTEPALQVKTIGAQTDVVRGLTRDVLARKFKDDIEASAALQSALMDAMMHASESK
jgi:hypothetical protein